jgi:hypothetical protein
VAQAIIVTSSSVWFTQESRWALEEPITVQRFFVHAKELPPPTTKGMEQCIGSHRFPTTHVK